MKLQTSIVAAGVTVGTLISTGLGVWQNSALANGKPADAEGIWLEAFVRAVMLGFPVNGVVALVIEPIGAVSMRIGVDPVYVLLLGIVINWTLIAWLLSKFVDRRSNGRKRWDTPTHP